jgi:two-component system CheB/CheR fusion protein
MPGKIMPPKMKHTAHGENSKAFPVIGIGASAGGLEALRDFFVHLPAPSECAFVVIVHLPHDHISLLPELLQRQTEIPVLTIEDGMAIAPNHIYVVPPGKDLSVFKNCFQLLDAVQGPGLHLPIDFFPQALAREKQSYAGCVILSGTGSDGTQGLKAIKAEGGVALVRDEASARRDPAPIFLETGQDSPAQSRTAEAV